MNRKERWAIFLIVVVIITSLFTGTWYGVRKRKTNDVEEIRLYVRNEQNNGTLFVEIDYKIDFSRDLNKREFIHGSLEKAKEAPFYIDFYFYNNASFGFFDVIPWVSYLDTLTMQVVGNGVNFTESGSSWKLTWYKSIINVERYHFRLYFSNIIRHPTTTTYSLNLEMWVDSYNKPELNNTFDISQRFWLDNLEARQIEITDSNIDFYQYNEHQKVGTDFYHQSNYVVDDGNSTHFVTRGNIDFTSLWSRRNLFISDIFFDLMVTFPISTIISYLVLDTIITADNKEEKKALKSLKKQTEEIQKEISELKQLLISNQQNNSNQD